MPPVASKNSNTNPVIHEKIRKSPTGELNNIDRIEFFYYVRKSYNYFTQNFGTCLKVIKLLYTKFRNLRVPNGKFKKYIIFEVTG